mmetsp:Transcript_26150/g.60990  ORF Transcript_26150/g.60990 Transcript_26150/m.60990 type:complete len:239 (+) Transcript_26150:50-766(+)
MGNIQSPHRPSRGAEQHHVRLAVTELFSVAGVTPYHSSVIVDNFEYFFDNTGIALGPALCSHQIGSQKNATTRAEVIDMGITSRSGRTMVQFLRPFFQRGSYDIIYKNCNHFSDCALYFLTASRLSSSYNRAERWMLSTDPLSTGLMNQMFRSYMTWATGKEFEGDVYVTNQLAEEFSAGEVIEYIDGMESGAVAEPSTAAATDSEEESEVEEHEMEPGCWNLGQPARPSRPLRRGHC